MRKSAPPHWKPVSNWPGPPRARIALVIGNSQYTSNKPLNNPTNDAQAVSQLLNNAGFEVVMAFDLARDLMKQTVEEFAARANEKGKNTVVLVYYAGHGIQVDGENLPDPDRRQVRKRKPICPTRA